MQYAQYATFEPPGIYLLKYPAHAPREPLFCWANKKRSLSLQLYIFFIFSPNTPKSPTYLNPPCHH